MIRRSLGSICSIVTLSLVAAAPASAETLYGISNGFGTPENNLIYRIDPANGDLSNIVQVTLPGFTVTNSQSLAVNPLDNTLWAVVQTGSGQGNRKLVTINPDTGVCTLVGNLANNITCLTFFANGLLLGTSGEGAANPPETLYLISKTDASLTLLFALGNGADGEIIATHPNGLVYHSSGNSVAEFESINVVSRVVSPIGTSSGEGFAMGYSRALGQMFISDISSDLYTVDINTGARTFVGAMSDQLGFADNRGLAFVAPLACPGDADGNSAVNFTDITTVLANFGNTCP
jgi:hypothetical protein